MSLIILSRPKNRSFMLYGMLTLLLLITAWLGSRSLNADAFWFDEVWSLQYAGGAEYGPISVEDTINRVASQFQHEKNPPGYYVLLNIWGRLVGWSEFAGRYLSLIAGLLAVAWTYRLGYDVASHWYDGRAEYVGLGAAVGLGGSAFFIYYFHEMRVYTLAVLLSVMTVWFYWRIVSASAKPSLIMQIGLVVCVAASLYLHYALFITLLLIALYHLLVVRKNREWLRIPVLGVTAGVLFLPWGAALLNATARAEGLQTVAMAPSEILQMLAIVFSNANVALLGFVAIYSGRGRGRGAGLTWFFVLGGVILALLISAVYPVFTHIRYLIILWPFLALMVGLGAERLARSGLSPNWLLAVWLAMGIWVTLEPTFNRSLNGVTMLWRELRTQLIAHGSPDDVVAFHAPDYDWFRDLEFQHYMAGLPERYTLLERIPGLPENDEYYYQAASYLGDASRVWLAVDKTLPQNFRLEAFGHALQDDFVHCRSAIASPEMTLDLYARYPQSRRFLPYQFGNGIAAHMLEAPYVDGNQVSVLAGWYKENRIPADAYSVALHIENESGKLVAQDDYGLTTTRYNCQESTWTLPQGRYTLYALVYNWQTGRRLLGHADGEPVFSDRIAVADLVID